MLNKAEDKKVKQNKTKNYFIQKKVLLHSRLTSIIDKW